MPILANAPARFASCSLKSWEGDLPDSRLPSWDGEPSHLTLWGETGAGKSHLAAALLARYRHRHPDASALWCPALELVERARQEIGEAKRRELADEAPMSPAQRIGMRAREVGILVLDDLLVERPTDYALEMLVGIICARWDDCRPIITTTNGSPAQIAKVYHPRIARRLFGAECLAVEVHRRNRQRMRSAS